MENKFQEIIEKKKKENQKKETSSTANVIPEEEKIKFCYQDMLQKFNIPKRFQNKTLENYDPSRLTNKNPFQKVKEYIKTYPERDEIGDWLVLTGGYGLGKTHLALAAGKEILKYYAKEHVKENPYKYRYIGAKTKAIFVNSSELISEIRDSYDSDMIDERQVMTKFKETPLLILDDLGTEKASDWQHEKMYLILNYRYNEWKNTIITTNLNYSGLQKQISERVVDRMYEAAGRGKYLWRMKGESYRKKGD
jgi:DNA replication protein DnaC